MEKVYTRLGSGFGKLSNMLVRIIKSIYGLAGSGRSFQLHLRSTLRNLGFEPTLHDKNLWVLKKADGSLVYISAFVDDLLLSGRRPWLYLEKLRTVYSLKTDVNLSRYLGMDLLQQDGTLAVSAEKYITESVRKIEDKSGCL